MVNQTNFETTKLHRSDTMVKKVIEKKIKAPLGATLW
ncbi:hypothetical protein BMS3Abin04_02366 [bacterium BMS3Abin04]|nr:hypothetical protein BMS3Abin04_02366 [bacterium BMS3Abin04]